MDKRRRPTGRGEAVEKDNRLKCSFCGKNQDQVKKLIAGPGVYICDECVGLCDEILDETVEVVGSSSTVTALDLHSAGPKRHQLPHPLKTVPEVVIVSATKSLETLIGAYEEGGKTAEAEPLYRALLVLEEHNLNALDVKLLPLLEQLYKIYNKEDLYGNCVYILEWMLSILDETKTTELDKTELLIKLTKMHIRMREPKKAEETLDRLRGP
jgi:hypothetical protein